MVALILKEKENETPEEMFTRGAAWGNIWIQEKAIAAGYDPYKNAVGPKPSYLIKKEKYYDRYY